MRFRNPGGISRAIATTKQVLDELGNASVQGMNATELRHAFLSWCDRWASPQLGNHFPATEGIFDEVRESYHRVVMAPEGPERQLYGLLHREFREWEARLARLLAELEKLAPFVERPGRLVVLDTSALMEGEFFAEFDWHALHKSLDDDLVRLVLPVLVVEELDELKRRSGERQRARARQVLAALWGLHGGAPGQPTLLPDSQNVTIEVLLDGGWHQRMRINDSEIIDQAVSVREMTGQPVIFASGDYSQLYRAASAGLIAALMSRPAGS